MSRLAALWAASRVALPVVLAALLGAWALWQYSQAQAARAHLATLKADFATYRATAERQSRQAVEDARAEERRVRKTQQEAFDAEFQKRQAAEADARRAVVANRGLRDELSATRSRFAARDPASAGECQAAGETVSVLTELLGRCSERRRELALFADQSHGAGQLCQQLSDALIK